MSPGDLAPDDADLGALDLTLGPVDVGDLLSAVELGGSGVVHTLELEQAVTSVNMSSASSNPRASECGNVPRVGVGVTLAALVAHMPTPIHMLVSLDFSRYFTPRRR